MLKVTLAVLVAADILSEKEGLYVAEQLGEEQVPRTFSETVDQVRQALERAQDA